MNIPYLSPHTRTELESALSWLEDQLIDETSKTHPYKDTWEKQAFSEGYMKAIWKLQKLVYDAGKKDINDIALALQERQEKLENELE